MYTSPVQNVLHINCTYRDRNPTILHFRISFLPVSRNKIDVETKHGRGYPRQSPQNRLNISTALLKVAALVLLNSSSLLFQTS